MDKVKALEQLSIRLSYMADGVEEELDEILARVRKLLKEGAEARSISAASDALARALMTHTGVNPDEKRHIEGGIDLSGLHKAVSAMPVRKEQQAQLTDLVAQVQSSTTTVARQKSLVDLLQVINEIIQHTAGRDSGDRRARSWLGKKSNGDGEGNRYVTYFAQLLGRLTDHIDVLNGSALRSQGIREALEQVVIPERAESLLADVTQEIEDIDRRLRAERNQATTFLGGLSERLDGFEDVLQLLAEHGNESLQRSERLQETVGEDTRELGEAAQTDDLQSMRSLLESSLSRITQRLTEHVLAEREQNERSQAQVAELKERLATLETEATQLRDEIQSKNDLALKDSLTGVYNRAGYEERSVELFARWKRAGAPLSMVFVDCNKFKQINDTFGHAAGDLVLMKVADVLRKRARASDTVCRYGGDEFIVLLPDTDAKGAEVFARSAFEEILAAGFNDNGRPLDVSISCGVTALKSGDTLDDAVERADKAMYQAKKTEGVQVCVVTE
jgi:diguanylate cyclase (GGDEF)-like protein